MPYVLELSLEIYIIEVFGILLLLVSYSRTFRRGEIRGVWFPMDIELYKKGDSDESIIRGN